MARVNRKDRLVKQHFTGAKFTPPMTGMAYHTWLVLLCALEPLWEGAWIKQASILRSSLCIKRLGVPFAPSYERNNRVNPVALIPALIRAHGYGRDNFGFDRPDKTTSTGEQFSQLNAFLGELGHHGSTNDHSWFIRDCPHGLIHAGALWARKPDEEMEQWLRNRYALAKPTAREVDYRFTTALEQTVTINLRHRLTRDVTFSFPPGLMARAAAANDVYVLTHWISERFPLGETDIFATGFYQSVYDAIDPQDIHNHTLTGLTWSDSAAMCQRLCNLLREYRETRGTL